MHIGGDVDELAALRTLMRRSAVSPFDARQLFPTSNAQAIRLRIDSCIRTTPRPRRPEPADSSSNQVYF